ncbi:MAG: alpha/beta hydrolase [Bacilli bacterium]|nr:alpha/beta hydrolase [Bacilli bacterium]
MMWLYITLGVIGGIIVILFFGLLVVYHGTFYTPLKGQNNDFVFTKVTEKYCDMETVHMMVKRMVEYPHEDAYIASCDHLKLHARIYKNNSDTVVIMFHGYRGTPCRDFSGGAYDMIQLGYNVILVDERGHKESKGHSITFGVKEKRDAKSWIEYAKKTFGEDKRIVLVGISMGGATVLLASDLLKEGDKVIADCPYTTPKEVISSTLQNNLKMNPKIFYPIANLVSIIFGHANLNKDDAEEHVKNSKAKIMIIHGEEDTLVPYKFSKRIADLHKDKVRYELFPKAEHGISYMVDNARYKRIIGEFLNDK